MSKLVVSIGHVEFTGGNQVLYVVKVQQDGDEWEVRRTFSDFRKLRDDVARVMKDARAHVVDDECSREFARGVQALSFPAKRLFGSKKDHVVKERAVELHHFLIRLLVLTHTYRKAQKTLYERQHSSHQHQAAFAALQDRTQASVSVFYLLRDFLKPITLRTNVDNDLIDTEGNGGSSARVGGAGARLEGEGQEDEESEASRRMIRESKMLEMSIGPRGSAPNQLKSSSTAPSRTMSYHVEQTPTRTMSHHTEPTSSTTTTHEHPPAPAPIPVTVVTPSESPSKTSDHSSSTSTANRTTRSNSKLVSVAAAGRSRSASRLQTPKSGHNLPTESLSDGRQRQVSASRVTKAASTSALAAQVDRARTESYMLRDQLLHQRQEKQKQEREHQERALQHTPTDAPSQHQHPKQAKDQKQQPIQVRSGEVPKHHEQFMLLMEQHQQQRHHSSASSLGRPKTASHPLDSSESSQTSESEWDGHHHPSRALSSASAGSAREAKHVLLTPEMTEKILSGGSSSAGGKSPSEKRRARAKKSSRSKHKGESARDIQLRESERLSRLSTQLTVQSISVSAQKELEKFVSEYTAIMVLRYVDRFISKAVTKAPGCYRVDAATHKLVIDSERFVEELEDTFTDLPATFPELFKDETGDWSFPSALDAYAQLKWNSFQGNMVSSGKGKATAGSRAGSDNDSDSDSDYEYEQIGGGGYMKTKKDFSRDEESMLQEMIANGTAGKDQVLRLRRQINEKGWNRRENPGTRSRRVLEDDESEDRDDDNSSDTEEEEDGAIDAARARARKRGISKSKSSCAVDRYQRRQNALRKDRLSHAQSVGGLV